jgi:hypothetical protein
MKIKSNIKAGSTGAFLKRRFQFSRRPHPSTLHRHLLPQHLHCDHCREDLRRENLARTCNHVGKNKNKRSIKGDKMNPKTQRKTLT